MDSNSNNVELFKKNVKKFMEINEQEEKIKEKMKELKNEKDGLENFILNFMEQNKITDRDIDVGDFKLKYSQNKKTESVTKKLILERLQQYFNGNEQKAKELLDFIYQERTSEMISSIKLSAKK